MKRLAAAMCFLALAACGDDASIDWTIVGKAVTDHDRTEITTAIDTLREVCPKLFEHADDIVKAEASVWDSFGYRADLYGWTREVTLNPTFSNTAHLPQDWRANGHTLYYYIGIGGMPGVVISKDVSMMVCGFPGQADDLFIPLRKN